MHSTAKEAARVASEAGVEHLLIGHYSARYKDYDQFENEAQEVFKSTVCARELRVQGQRQRNTSQELKNSKHEE